MDVATIAVWMDEWIDEKRNRERERETALLKNEIERTKRGERKNPNRNGTELIYVFFFLYAFAYTIFIEYKFFVCTLLMIRIERINLRWIYSNCTLLCVVHVIVIIFNGQRNEPECNERAKPNRTNENCIYNRFNVISVHSAVPANAAFVGSLSAAQLK